MTWTWYYLIPIIYFVIVFLNITTVCIKERSAFHEWLIALGGLLIITPFLAMIGLYKWLTTTNVFYIESHTIHKLTKENKITLRNLNFREGEFVSRSNQPYKGFKLGTRITVTYDGHITIWEKPDKETKIILQQLRRLPDDPKQSIQRSITFYQDQMTECNKRIEEKQKELEELNENK